MADRIGKEYEGMVTSVTEWGMYVELPNTVEGLVRLDDMVDDYYHFDRYHMTLTGETTRKQYGIGTRLKIRVSWVDLQSRSVQFVLPAGNDTKETNERM